MTDEKIIDLFFERDEDAIKETDKKYGRYFHYIAFSVLGSDTDAEETVNDTYMKAWSVIPPKRPDPFKIFLGKITRRISINKLEKRLAQKRGGGDYDLILDELSDVVSDNIASDPESEIALRDTLNLFLSSLKTTERIVFVRRYWYMNSVKEISSALRIGESKTKSMLMRTREKLKAALIKEGFEL